MMRSQSFELVVVAALLLTLPGCGKKAPAGVPHTHNPHTELTVCGQCGEIKDGEKCCKEGIALCENCGLHKGSILCCSTAINGRRDVILCRTCGEVKFTKKCCVNGGVAAACPKCGMHKGSPGCCKYERVVDDGHESFEHAHEGGHDGHS